MPFSAAPGLRCLDEDKVCIHLLFPFFHTWIGWFAHHFVNNLVGHQRKYIIARYVGSYHLRVFWEATLLPSRG